jgi:uncharacterized small protein (DUF1192 family)
MSDQCKNCTYRGDIEKCKGVEPCILMESWITQELLDRTYRLTEHVASLRAQLGSSTELVELQREEIKRLKGELAKYKNGVSEVHALIESSYGVAGLHLNGDVAPWSELMKGGRFEDWLADLPDKE